MVPEDLLPKGSTISATWQSLDGFEVLGEAEGCVVHVDVGNWGTFARVAGATSEIAGRIGRRLQEKLDAAEADRVGVFIWNAAYDGGSFDKRLLSVRSWKNIDCNYPKRTRALLDSLMQCRTTEEEKGRLILFHGEPGTGKTNAIRALIMEWSPWCDIHLVTDPDKLFANASYMLDVMKKSAELSDTPTLTSVTKQNRWKLVIAEDADADLIAGTVHNGGATLGRLLNATDGLLAQSAQLLVLLTTNASLRQLHPAITRPGRCLAEIEFSRFSAVEAKDWLAEEADFEGSATLADLYQLRQTGKHPTAECVTGMYL
jgi:hypothetical protein